MRDEYQARARFGGDCECSASNHNEFCGRGQSLLQRIQQGLRRGSGSIKDGSSSGIELRNDINETKVNVGAAVESQSTTTRGRILL